MHIMSICTYMLIRIIGYFEEESFIDAVQKQANVMEYILKGTYVVNTFP